MYQEIIWTCSYPQIFISILSQYIVSSFFTFQISHQNWLHRKVIWKVSHFYKYLFIDSHQNDTYEITMMLIEPENPAISVSSYRSDAHV